eukprot:scaffold21815_cov119-Isochrysis_galbana.AAC.2
MRRNENTSGRATRGRGHAREPLHAARQRGPTITHSMSAGSNEGAPAPVGASRPSGHDGEFI